MLRGLAAVLGVWAVGAAALRVVAVPPQYCPPVTSAQALASAQAAAGWIERAQQPDGSYTYEFNADSGAYSAEYNSVRHAGVTMALYQLAAIDPSVLPTADRGLTWMQDHMARYNGWAALKDPADGSIELGAGALMLTALAQRRIHLFGRQSEWPFGGISRRAGHRCGLGWRHRVAGSGSGRPRNGSSKCRPRA